MDHSEGRHLPIVRPVTRGDCSSVPRPCPFVSCRFNLLIDVQHNGAISFNVPGADLPPCSPSTPPEDFDAIAERATDAWASAPVHSCALDLIDARCGEESTLDEIGEALGVSKQRVDAIVKRTLPKLAKPIAALRGGAK